MNGLNPEPTDVQLALFKRHKRAGTSPGNPEWYERERQKVKPFEFKAGLPPKYPRYPTGAQWQAKHGSNSARRGSRYRGWIETRYTDGSVVRKEV